MLACHHKLFLQVMAWGVCVSMRRTTPRRNGSESLLELDDANAVC